MTINILEQKISIFLLWWQIRRGFLIKSTHLVETMKWLADGQVCERRKQKRLYFRRNQRGLECEIPPTREFATNRRNLEALR